MPTDDVHKYGTDDGWHGVIEPDGQFEPAVDRYHLYIGLFCPFAHRAYIVRHLKNLQDFITVSVVKPFPKGDEKGWPGWCFPNNDTEYPGATVDHLFGSKYLHEVYFRDDRDFKGRYSVPLLWDKHTSKIVNNESAELLRWLPTAFDSIRPKTAGNLDLYPLHHRSSIDRISEWMQRDINTGVYKAGFAPNQESYDKNVVPLFGALNKVEQLLAVEGGPFFLGENMTELDIRLYTTIVRFDAIYVQHFKCNLGTIRHDYPQINNWLKHLYWNVPGFRETTDFRHIKEIYTKSHYDINPKAITPMGPFPHVETEFEPNFSRIPVGGVRMDEVERAASEISR